MENRVDVTSRVLQVKQPYGGYLNPKSMTCKKYDGDLLPIEKEVLNPSLISVVVDSLTKFMTGSNIVDAFKDSIRGYAIAKYAKRSSMISISIPDLTIILNKIKDLSDFSITSAAKLCSFQIWSKNAYYAEKYAWDVRMINLDNYTLDHIRIMVRRSIDFFNNCGGVIKSNVQTECDENCLIKKADIDYLTTKEVLNMVVSSNAKLNSKKTLELLIDYIISKKSKNDDFKSVNTMGVFNPRLNAYWSISADDIPTDILTMVENEVIGYNRENARSIRNVF